ncbi:MAG: Gfo/Idh/MocA family oxidoreductase [Thermaerobacter sp.]|nr:Gfo/Idh/MocA family oxidoreductase [Thermaerobacter sp.]
MAQVRLALVGCGKIGQRHLQALVHQNRAALVATVDSERERAVAAAVAFDADAFETLEEMQHAVEVDAIILATPSGTHRALAEWALAAGLHVMVEKPLALSYRDAAAIVAAGQSAGRVVTATQFNRLLPAVAQAVAAYQRGQLGRVIEGAVALRWARPQSYYDAAAWRGTRSMDGGVLYNQAIHALDILLQFTGPAEEVFAFAGTLTHAIETEDTLVASIRFGSGALGTVTATTSVPDTNLEERVTVIGDKGVVVIGPTPQTISTWRIAGEDEDTVRDSLAALPARPGWQSHADALVDFTEAILGKIPARLDAASGLPVLAVIEAAMRSVDLRRPVRIDEVQAG